MFRKLSLLILLQIMMTCFVMASSAVASTCDGIACPDQTQQTQATPELRCSSDLRALQQPLAPGEKGILTIIVEEIKGTLNNAYEALYEGILASQFPSIASALMVLSVIIFGIMFALGMVQMPLHDALKRILKMLVVASIVGPGGLAFFNEYVYDTFRNGTDELLFEITSTITEKMGGTASPTNSEDAGPFKPMDDLIRSLVNPSMSMNIEGAASMPPYGMFYAAVLFFGGFFLIGAIARAVWVYLVSLVAMSFLFGIAPIFITFILFQQTRNMFDAWLKQLINFSLQPIFMFTFIGFFIVMIQESLKSLGEADVCYAPSAGMTESGHWETSALRFKDKKTGQVLDVIFESDGPKCIIGTDKKECPDVEFPIDFIDILTFVVLAYVANQFYNYVVEMSQDISGAYVNLETASPVSNFMNKAGGLADKALSNVIRGNDPTEGIIPKPRPNSPTPV